MHNQSKQEKCHTEQSQDTHRTQTLECEGTDQRNERLAIQNEDALKLNIISNNLMGMGSEESKDQAVADLLIGKPNGDNASQSEGNVAINANEGRAGNQGQPEG